MAALSLGEKTTSSRRIASTRTRSVILCSPDNAQRPDREANRILPFPRDDGTARGLRSRWLFDENGCRLAGENDRRQSAGPAEDQRISRRCRCASPRLAGRSQAYPGSPEGHQGSSEDRQKRARTRTDRSDNWTTGKGWQGHPGRTKTETADNPRCRNGREGLRNRSPVRG